MPAVLRVTLLGDFGLARGTESITPGGSARGCSLLAHLILHRQAPQPRQRLAFLLWPDSTESQARTNLRRELHHLRRDLPEADRHLRVESGTLQWRPDSPARVDLVEFEDAVARADEAAEAGDRESLREHLAEAAARYGGDFLPDSYERWIEPERERLRRDLARTLERLVGVCREVGDLRSAIRHAERLVRHEPLREASYVRLMDLHGAAGDRAAALEAFRRCEETLARELEVEPGPATVEARDRAMAGPVEPVAPESPPSESPRSEPVAADSPPPVPLGSSARPDPRPPLVGRERERRIMERWLDRTLGRSAADEADEADDAGGAGRAGNAGDASPGGASPAKGGPGGGAHSVLFLLGEPGIGKTRLLDELASDVRSRGGRAIRGRGFEAETVRPYGAWIDALRSLPREWMAGSEELGSLIPDLRGGSARPSDRNRLFDAVARWLADLADTAGPVALLMDDVQWLDEASAALLHYVTRVLADEPVPVACAARPGELDESAPVSRLVRALERGGRARTVRLEPLGRDDILALARLLGDDVSGDRIFADSGGNPLFALELARTPAGEDAAPGVGVEELIRGRIARLEEPASEVLPWAAALGRSFDPATLAHLLGRPLADLLPALDALEHHGILRPGDPEAAKRSASPAGRRRATYDFAHDIVRRTAYDSLSAPRRRLVHLHIARALSELDDPEGALAGDVSHHAALGGDAALAARASVAAGDRCLRIFAHAEATELSRRGIEHARALDGPERVRLQMALLRVAVAAGSPPVRAAELDEQIRALIADARSLGLVDEEALGYGLLSVLSYEHDEFSRVHETSVRAAEALRDGEEDPVSDPGVTARALGQAGACLASIERDMPRAESLLRKAESLARREGMELIDIPMGLGAVRYFDGDHEEAVRHLERGLGMARRERDHFRACECLSFLVMLELDAGAPGRALARCRELEPVASKLKGGSDAPFARALNAAARYALVRGDTPVTATEGDASAEGHVQEGDAAGDLAEALDELRRLDASRKLSYVLAVAAEVDLEAGRPDEGRERADEALRAARRVDHRSGMARAGALRVRSLRALGEVETAAEALESLKESIVDGDGLSARAREALDVVDAHPSSVA